ncbi:M23 family metallopeptidase [Acinetobacter rudis]|uniref:M23 family metallopeptidase n=1 Tax=Acinetobacter rudis TaxID=632955 RepID=A0AAW8J6Q6_9GAMM|nr:M23 family metallopeptidase [Acinetobacter rudis]MDQ8934255.1 M23 family metallopeptidase [Acinetobacter rudis]MDQ8952588.1 M23 family metallopeptidase [Acinetobacter rudis]MDQ9016437.1 M23 family metallopeptidase [Acinetobacter rudis]
MFASLRYALILCSIVVLAACQSTPKKKPITSNSAQAIELKRMSFPKRLPVPVDGIQSKNLTDTWGASRSQGRTHEGIDILAPRGTKVYSATDGIVMSLKGNNLGGKVIWIMGPAGSWHYYAHLNDHARKLKEGDYVRAGTLIGYVGNTGNARHTAPHLHYGVYLSGKGRGATNPYPYLR